MYASDCNVFCITETWLSEKISNGEILPSGYVLYRCDRPSLGGGVLIAVHKSLSSSTLILSPSDLEVVLVKLGLNNPVVICCVYVPPNSTFLYISSLVKLTKIVLNVSLLVISIFLI